MIECLEEAFVRQMRRVEDDVQPLHLVEQLAPPWPQTSTRVRAHCVAAGSVMRRTNGAQPLRVRPLDVRQRENRVRSFKAQDVADRDAVRPWAGAPSRHLSI